MPVTDHTTFMTECLALAARGQGNVAPNPLVGSVVVHAGRIIGRGFHERYGEHHAEVNAVASVADPTLLKDSTLYVNLEPCCHFGKTPPCTDLIIGARIPRVVAGIIDPHARVAGGGVRRLREAGVDVTVGVSLEECFEINRRFFTYHALKRPYVVLKWAETADRFIARSDGSSKWISSESSRILVHEWRRDEAAVMVGTRTALVDDPALTVRHVNGKNPLRIVLDRALTLPPTLQLFDHSTPTIVFNTRADRREPNLELVALDPSAGVKEILENLHRRGILSVLVEGGGRILQSFLESDLWDEARVFRNSQLAFGAGTPAPRIEREPFHNETIGGDELAYYQNHWTRDIRGQG